MRPYGQSVFADAIDAIQVADLTFDAMISEVDNGEMRAFPSHVMFDQEEDGRGWKVSIPFGRRDCTVFRKVMSTEDTILSICPAEHHRLSRFSTGSIANRHRPRHGSAPRPAPAQEL